MPRRLLAAHWLFLVLAVLGCGAFVAITPAGYGLDEQSHIYRAEQIAEGTLWAEKLPAGQGWGGYVPKALHDYVQFGWAESNAVDRSAFFYQRRDAADPAARARLAAQPYGVGDVRVAADFVNSAVYSPVPYLPAAAGFVVARVLHTDVGTAVLLAKAFNALAYVLIGFAALLLVRDLAARWLIFAIALLPAVVFQSSVITADTFTNIGALFFTAAVLRLMSHPIRDTYWSTAALGLGALALGLMKPSYAPLLLLALAIPARHLGGRLVAWVARSAAVVVPLAVAGGVYLVTSGASAALKNQRGSAADQLDAAAQLRGVLADPLGFAQVVVRTWVKFGDSWRQGIIGLFGYDTIPVPEPLKIIAMSVLLIAALYAAKLRPRVATLWLVAAIGVFFAILGALYLTFDPVGMPYVDGVQGRYFIAELAVVALAVASFVPVRLTIPPRWEPLVFAVPTAFVLAGSAAVYAIALY